jgi:hypothetical protein
MKLQLSILTGVATLAAAQQGLPQVKLPYGTWQAAKYDRANDVATPELLFPAAS